MSTSKVQIHGTVAPGFESVRELFASNFQAGKEGNAQLCVYVGEEKVVDLWGTSSGDTSYDGDSLQNVFSATKSVTAIAIATLVDKKLIKYDDKVAQHWPEFAQNGKEDVTLDKILRHEGGMAWFDHTFKMEDLLTENIKKNAIGKVIEQQPLRFPPAEAGTTREYHSLSRGWILNEVFRRVDPQGRTIGEWLREEVSGPLGVDVYIGVKPEKKNNIQNLEAWPFWYILLQSMVPKAFGRKIDPNLMKLINVMSMWKSDGRPPPLDCFQESDSIPDSFNSDSMREGEMPSANGHCSARGLAKLGSVMANKGKLNGVQMMSEETWEAMHDHITQQLDYGFKPIVTKFSQGGVCHFEVSDHEKIPEWERGLCLKRKDFYGWIGLGGSVFQWHPELKIGMAYTTSLVAWFDPYNIIAAELQGEVLKCVRNTNSKQ